MWRRDNLGRGCSLWDDGEGIPQGSALALSSLLSSPSSYQRCYSNQSLDLIRGQSTSLRANSQTDEQTPNTTSRRAPRTPGHLQKHMAEHHFQAALQVLLSTAFSPHRKKAIRLYHIPHTDAATCSPVTTLSPASPPRDLKQRPPQCHRGSQKASLYKGGSQHGQSVSRTRHGRARAPRGLV